MARREAGSGAGPDTRRGGRVRLVLTCLALVCLTLVAPPLIDVAGADQVPLTREVAGSTDKLARLRSEIADARAALDSLGSHRDSARRDLVRVVEEIGLIKELLAGLDQREALLRQQRDTLQTRLVSQRETYALRKRALAERLRAIYMEGPQRDLELILTSESFSTLVARLEFNTMLARLDGNLVDRTRRQARAIEAEEQQLRAALAGIWEAREEARRERANLELLEAERRGLLRELEEEQDRQESQLAELRRQERRLTDLLARLEQQRQQPAVEPDEAGPAGRAFVDRRGDLPWPASGAVVREFGRNVHPRFRTVTMHNGVSLETVSGAPVYAVAPGTVQFADHLPGYGQCVILDHGSGFYTLYANLARIFPARGGRVRDGQILAEVEAGEANERPTLYFEIREGREARNPRDWLRPLR